jgi:para-aminobenzoate synthetase component 2
MTHILVIDNYDSFVYTLNGYLHQLGATSDVVRNDDISLQDLATAVATYDGILVSPGPGNPHDAGVSIAIVQEAKRQNIPLLGVCLGHQAIAEAFGATVAHAEELMHGKTSQVIHDESTLFTGVPPEFQATRYHSLAVVDGTVPSELVVTARTLGGVIMGLNHQSAPIFGVQFHPESVMTESGYLMIGNWLEITGLAGARDRAQGLSPRASGTV